MDTRLLVLEVVMKVHEAHGLHAEEGAEESAAVERGEVSKRSREQAIRWLLRAESLH